MTEKDVSLKRYYWIYAACYVAGLALMVAIIVMFDVELKAKFILSFAATLIALQYFIGEQKRVPEGRERHRLALGFSVAGVLVSVLLIVGLALFSQLPEDFSGIEVGNVRALGLAVVIFGAVMLLYYGLHRLTIKIFCPMIKKSLDQKIAKEER